MSDLGQKSTPSHPSDPPKSALNIEEFIAARSVIIRLRGQLDWILTVPAWENAIGRITSGLALEGQRQGVSQRQALMALPIDSKRALVRSLLKGNCPPPTSAACRKLMGLWQINRKSFDLSDSSPSHRDWSRISQQTLLKLGLAHSAYKKAQNILYQIFEYSATNGARSVCWEANFLDDCIQEARIGLLKAIDRIQAERDFSSYATQWAQRAARNFLLKNKLPVSTPINLISKASQLARSECADSSPDKRNLSLVFRYLQDSTLSFDEMDPDFNADRTVGQDIHSPAYNAIRSDLRELVESRLLSLSAKQREVLQMRYGFAGDEFHETLEPIAKRIGITRQQVTRREERALSKLSLLLQPLRGEIS